VKNIGNEQYGGILCTYMQIVHPVGPMSLVSLESWISCRQNHHPGSLVSCVFFYFQVITTMMAGIEEVTGVRGDFYIRVSLTTLYQNNFFRVCVKLLMTLHT
jgi:hypothetical protein